MFENPGLALKKPVSYGAYGVVLTLRYAVPPPPPWFVLERVLVDITGALACSGS